MLLLVPSFLGGILTIVSPCILPVILFAFPVQISRFTEAPLK